MTNEVIVMHETLSWCEIYLSYVVISNPNRHGKVHVFVVQLEEKKHAGNGGEGLICAEMTW